MGSPKLFLFQLESSAYNMIKPWLSQKKWWGCHRHQKVKKNPIVLINWAQFPKCGFLGSTQLCYQCLHEVLYTVIESMSKRDRRWRSMNFQAMFSKRCLNSWLLRDFPAVPTVSGMHLIAFTSHIRDIWSSNIFSAVMTRRNPWAQLKSLECPCGAWYGALPRAGPCSHEAPSSQYTQHCWRSAPLPRLRQSGRPQERRWNVLCTSQWPCHDGE